MILSKKRPSLSSGGKIVRKRRAVHAGTSSSTSQESRKDSSARQQAEQYRLKTVQFPIQAVTPVWKDGVNRLINHAHKQQLCASFRQGLYRTEPTNRLRLLCTKTEMSRMVSELQRRGNDVDDGPEGNGIQGRWPSFMEWANINPEPVELMAGNHRVEALKQYLQQTGQGPEEYWWICDIYDRDSLPLELSIKLRANREDLALADSHGQIWTEMATLASTNPTLFHGSTIEMEAQMTKMLGLGGKIKFPVRRLGTLWRNIRWRDMITRWCDSSFGRSTFNISTFEWMSSCRIDDFWFGTLNDTMATLARIQERWNIDINVADWTQMALLPTARNALEVQNLFYPDLPDDHTNKFKFRPKNFGAQWDDSTYDQFYEFVLGHPEMSFPNVSDMLKISKQDGKWMSVIMCHVGQWLNRDPFRVTDRASSKPPLRDDFLPALRARYGADDAEPQSIDLQSQVIRYVRRHVSQLADPAIVYFLDQYPIFTPDGYRQRFEHESWRGLLRIVHKRCGAHFQSEAMLYYNHHPPTDEPPQAASTLALSLSTALRQLPEISRNPALRCPEAIDALAQSITPTIVTWAITYCERSLARQITAESAQNIRDELQQYQLLTKPMATPGGSHRNLATTSNSTKGHGPNVGRASRGPTDNWGRDGDAHSPEGESDDDAVAEDDRENQSRPASLTALETNVALVGSFSRNIPLSTPTPPPSSRDPSPSTATATAFSENLSSFSLPQPGVVQLQQQKKRLFRDGTVGGRAWRQRPAIVKQGGRGQFNDIRTLSAAIRDVSY